MTKVRVWSYEDDVSEVDVSDRYHPEQIVRDYIMRHYDEGWSDFVKIYMQGPNERKPLSFNVTIEPTITINVRPTE